MSTKNWYTLALGAGVLVTAVAVAPAIARINHGRTAAPEAPAAAASPQSTPSDDAKWNGVDAQAGPERQWVNSKRFMEIQSGRTRDGGVYLKVRPAKKRILGESFETVPVPGPYTEVAVVDNARILHLDGESGTADAFVLDLASRDNPVEGFDLTFDGQGRVTQVDWLYVPARPGKPPAGPGRQWVNSKRFMEIQSGRTRDGGVYLKVRPAKKRILGESFETVPVPGPYTEVAVAGNARILHLDGESGTADAFVLDLASRDNPVEGFDLTFDGQGRVTRVDWLYVL